jgi:hypothetical protein
VPTSPADLLAAATERAKAEGLDIDYRLGDAEQLPFEDGAFDAVVSTCGVMFASRPEAGGGGTRAGLPEGRARSRSRRGCPTATCSRCSR